MQVEVKAIANQRKSRVSVDKVPLYHAVNGTSRVSIEQWIRYLQAEGQGVELLRKYTNRCGENDVAR